VFIRVHLLAIHGSSRLLHSASTSLGQQLALGLKPIRLRVTGQREPAASFGNEIRAQLNLVVRWLRGRSGLWRHCNFLLLRSRNLFTTRREFFSARCRTTRPRRFSGLYFGSRRASFRRRLIFALDNFGLFRHRLKSVNDFNSFNALRPVGKCFLAVR